MKHVTLSPLSQAEEYAGTSRLTSRETSGLRRIHLSK
jgi:hypothetical protein